MSKSTYMEARTGSLMRNLALYYGARVTGQIGHNVFIAALFVAAGTGGHSAMGLSSLMLAMTVSAIAFGLPGGAIADRLGAGRGFAMGSGLRAAVVAFALISQPSTAALIAIAFVYAAVSQVHNSSEMALVKSLCHRSPGRVHSLLVAMQYGGQAAAFLVIVPSLYYLGGVQAAIAGSLIITLGAMLLTNLLAHRLRGTDVAFDRGDQRRFSGIRQTFSFFARTAPARDALAVNAMKSLVTQVILVAFPLYVKHDLSLGTEGAILVIAPGIAGAAIGLAWAATALSLDGAARAMRLSIAGMTVAVFALASLDYGVSAAFLYSQVPPLVHFEAALNTTAVVAMPVAFLIGATLSVAMVSSRAALTAAAPVAIQSRAFAVQSTASDALVVLPLLFAGVVAELLGARMTLLALGSVCGITWLLVWHPRFQVGIFARHAEVSA
ncbi:MAG: MFS transporter [bacterium]